MLKQECQGAYVMAYQMDDKMLVWVLKDDDNDVELNFNLKTFLGDTRRRLLMRGEEEEMLAEVEIAPDDSFIVSGPMDKLRIIEIC